MLLGNVVVAVQSLNRVWLCDPMDCRILYLPLSFGVCSNSCPLSWWYHPIASTSAAVFFFCLQSFPASGSFEPMSWLFSPSGQSIEVSASVSVLPMNIQGWFPLGLTGLISLQSKGLLRVFFITTLLANMMQNSPFNPKHCKHILRRL